MRPSRSRNARGWNFPWLILTMLAYLYAPIDARPAAATAVDQEMLIEVLFGQLPDPGGLDANGDMVLTVADIVLLGPQLFGGAPAELVPHSMGDQLVYQVTDPLGAVTTETITVTSADASGAFVIDDLQVNGAQVVKHETQSYTDTGSEIFFSGGTDLRVGLRTTCNPLLLRLIVPLIAGQTSSTTVQCEVRTVRGDLFVGTINRTDSFTPQEIVDSVMVPAGTYTHVVHISGRTDLSGDIETDEFYFAPGIGAVLQLSTAGGQLTRHELTGHTIASHQVAR